MTKALVITLICLAGPALTQGVPTFDAGLFLQRERILTQGDRDLVVQRDRLSQEEALAEIEAQQLQALQDILELEAIQTVGAGQSGVADAATLAEERRYMDFTLPELHAE